MHSKIDLSTVNIEREERHGVHPLMAFEAIPEIASGEYPYQHIKQNNLVKSSVAKALEKFKSKSPWSVKYTNTEFKNLQDEIVTILESLKKVDINKVYIRVRKITDSITLEKQ